MRPFILCLLVALLVGCASTNRGSSGNEQMSNSDIVVKVLQDGLVGGDLDVINRYVAEDYIQHNPMAETGRAGLIWFIEYLKAQPADQRISMKIMRVFEDGDFVVSHSDVMLGGKRHAVFDVFRMKNGQLAEHWDAIQEHPEKTASGHSMLDGATESTDLDKTEANKQLARKFFDEVLVGGAFDKLPGYFDGENYTQHNPWVGDGVSTLGKAFAEMAQQGITMRIDQVVRVLGRGNFVLLQSRGEFKGKPAVFYDLLRIKDAKIAEHWDVIQEIPAESRNNNGMLPD
jgi:predicted SnoaL-like aldol condensation-catalyzing enzyme